MHDLLTNWVHDTAKGDRYRLPLEFVIKKQSHDTECLFGMQDRGTLEPGMKVDLNLIDLDALHINTSEMIYAYLLGCRFSCRQRTGM